MSDYYVIYDGGRGVELIRARGKSAEEVERAHSIPGVRVLHVIADA